MSDLLSFYYNIFINNEELDATVKAFIDEITIEDNADGSDLLTIVLNDPSFIFIEDDIFLEEMPIRFEGGWVGKPPIKFSGYISIIDIDFPDDGTPVLSISCMDKTYLMNKSEKKRTWSKMKVSDVVTAIFKEYGLKAEVDATSKVEETISQSNVSDINFIIDLADKEADEYLVYVEGDTGYFKKKKMLDAPQKTLSYRCGGLDIMSFKPSINKASKKEEVTTSNVDDKTKGVETAKVDNNTNREVQGSTVKSSSSNKPTKNMQYMGNGVWKES